MNIFFHSSAARPFLWAVFALLFLFAENSPGNIRSDEGFPRHLAGVDADKVDWRAKDENYWRAVLSKKRFRICRKGGTEFPYTGKYDSFYKEGVYRCSSCGLELFSSAHKYDSRTGWPSFWRPANATAVGYKPDYSFGVPATEIVCGRCGAHLGHVFNDGPGPTGKRYCVNSICLFHENTKGK